MDADRIPDTGKTEGPVTVDDTDDLDEDDSGFGINGKPVRFTSNKFWKYVNYMLNLLYESVCKNTTSKEEFDCGTGR